MNAAAAAAAAIADDADTGVAAQADDAPRRSEERKETAEFGFWIFLASEVMFFGGLFFAYVYGRISYPEGWAAASRATDVVIGTANTAVLLTSSFLVALAVAAGQADRRRWVAPLLSAAATLGVVFLALKGVEYRHDWAEGLFPGPQFRLDGATGSAVPAGAQLFYMLYYTMTGVHALHLTVGIAWMAVAAIGARRDPEVWCSPARLAVAGLYWHFVDVVWIFLYPLVYLVSRTS